MDFDFLASTELFRGVSVEEVRKVLSCLAARERSYFKGDIIYSTGDTVKEIGLVEEGSVNVVVNFLWGDSNIFGHVEKGEVFAETYAAVADKPLLCDVVAAENCRILFVDMSRLLTTCRNGCEYHNAIIHNIVAISAAKNLGLSSRMMHIASKSIRGRLLSYLNEQSIENGSRYFTIPFSRQQLADYLNVDRSALSNELSKMQKDGLIDFHRSDFYIKEGSFVG